jgi:sortase B
MGNRVNLIILAVAVAVFAVSLGLFFSYQQRYAAARGIYESIREQALLPVLPPEAGDAPDGTLADPSEDRRAIDFDRLRAINPDVVAWLRVEGTRIDYPVVQAVDNDYYLRHTVNREVHVSGSIFLDAANRPDFSDPNTIVYGHRMKDGSMFDDLKKYLDPGFLADHRTIQLVREEGVQTYRIVAAYQAEVRDVTLFPTQLDEAGLAEYAVYVANKARLAKPPATSVGDVFLSLVTCSYFDDDARIFVHAIRVPDEGS